MEDRQFKGIWIPAEIWLNNELSVMDRVMFAEIDSLDGENGCFASNEYFAEFFNVGVATVTRSIAKLKSLGLIESKFDGRTRSLRVIKMIRQTHQNDEADSSKNEFLLYIENKKENNIEKAPAEPSLSFTKNRRRDIISRSTNTLVDDLESGKDIDKQNKAKKKSPKELFREECLEIIEREYGDSVAEILTDYFNFISDPKLADSDNKMKVVKTVSAWRKKLDKLDELVKEGYDCEKLIKQSLENKKYVFYPLENVTRNSQYNNQRDKFETCDVIPSQMTHEEILAEKQRRIDAGAKIY